jgi:hypothetical protein
MDRKELMSAFEPSLGNKLSGDLVDQYIQIRRDYVTTTLGRAAPGKFVEVFVQIVQYLARGKYDARPNVEGFLLKDIETLNALDDGIRICAARIARSMYSLRNKRSIAHKNEIDPNSYDLMFLHSGASWIVAELLRVTKSVSMVEAGKIIQLLQVPPGKWVEDIAGRRLVHGNFGIRQEILVLLHSYYPETRTSVEIQHSLNRRSSGSVRNEILKLYREKTLEGNAKVGYVLTTPGYKLASDLV